MKSIVSNAHHSDDRLLPDSGPVEAVALMAADPVDGRAAHGIAVGGDEPRIDESLVLNGLVQNALVPIDEPGQCACEPRIEPSR